MLPEIFYSLTGNYINNYLISNVDHIGILLQMKNIVTFNIIL